MILAYRYTYKVFEILQDVLKTLQYKTEFGVYISELIPVYLHAINP